MKPDSRLSLFAVVSTVFLLVLAISPTARAVSVTFDQVSWGNGNGGYEDQNSQWGEATVGFSAGDASLLTPNGSGGYFGYLNLVTSVAGGSNNNWAVENLPMYFNSASDLAGGELPTTIDFDLGQTDGTSVSSLNYYLELDAAPLSLQPSGTMSPATVASETEVDGSEGDPNEFGDEDAGGGPASDTVGAPAGTGFGQRGSITGNETNVPAINESVNGCAPGAKARSIVYLSKMFPGSISVTQMPQQVYGTLTNLMGSSTGPNSSGTSLAGITNGANGYFATNGLSIGPTLFTNGVGYLGAAINCLNSTGDVEVGISWGYYKNAGTNVYRGAHMAFVSSLTPNTNAAGQVISYTIRYIEDSSQGNNMANNDVKTMTITNGGLDASAPPGVMGQGVTGFFLENVTVPEPSSFVMAALGAGALGLSVVYRRPKRKQK